MVHHSLLLKDLPANEQNAVTQLRARMAGSMDKEMFEDISVFVRFLRARDLNLNNAEAMLRNHIEWRKMNQVDNVLRDYVPKEVCEKYVTFNTIGVDKEGSPIVYFHVGGLDPRGILKSCRRVDIIKCIIQKLEANILIMKKQSQKRGKHIDKWTVILNFEGFTFGVATNKQFLELVGNLIVMYEANYPERLKIAYFINASIYFNMAFAVVKHFLSGPTYRKIRFFGNDGWLNALLEYIDIEVLPAFLGGKQTDPDGNPLCKSFIVHGGAVPESYFINKKETTLANVPGVEKLTITRKSKTQLTLDVTESGSTIEWEFEAKSRDIAFSLLYRKNNIENITTELIPKQRIETYMSSETGLYKCIKPGVYIIEFDNTYSWLFQKEIYYRISIVKCPLIQ